MKYWEIKQYGVKSIAVNYIANEEAVLKHGEAF